MITTHHVQPQPVTEHELARPHIPSTDNSVPQIEGVRTIPSNPNQSQLQTKQLPPSSPFVSEDGTGKDAPTENGVGRIQTVGQDDICGFPCCNCTNQHLACEDAPIPELRGIYSTADWKIFTLKVRHIIHVHSPRFVPFGPLLNLCGHSPQSYHNQRTRVLQELIDEENVKLGAIGLKWSLNTYWSLVTRDGVVPTDNNRWTDQQEIKLTMTWIPGIREAYEAAHPDQRQITQEPYPEQLISPAEKERRAAVKLEEEKQEQKQLQLAQLKLLQSLVSQGQLTSAQISALGLDSNGSSGGPPVYGVEPGPPGGLVPIIQAEFCSGCGASRAGVTGPFCPKCGFKAS